ncbi:hypothetical protein T484DRAFT_1883641, partial [Baffinella frigidus]
MEEFVGVLVKSGVVGPRGSVCPSSTAADAFHHTTSHLTDADILPLIPLPRTLPRSALSPLSSPVASPTSNAQLFSPYPPHTPSSPGLEWFVAGGVGGVGGGGDGGEGFVECVRETFRRAGARGVRRELSRRVLEGARAAREKADLLRHPATFGVQVVSRFIPASPSECVAAVHFDPASLATFAHHLTSRILLAMPHPPAETLHASYLRLRLHMASRIQHHTSRLAPPLSPPASIAPPTPKLQTPSAPPSPPASDRSSHEEDDAFPHRDVEEGAGAEPASEGGGTDRAAGMAGGRAGLAEVLVERARALSAGEFRRTDRPLVLIQGEEGSGRSAFLTSLALRIQTLNGTRDARGGARDAAGGGGDEGGEGGGGRGGGWEGCLVVHVEREAGWGYREVLGNVTAEVCAQGCGDPALLSRQDSLHLSPFERLVLALAEARRVSGRRVVLLIACLRFNEAVHFSSEFLAAAGVADTLTLGAAPHGKLPVSPGSRRPSGMASSLRDGDTPRTPRSPGDRGGGHGWEALPAGAITRKALALVACLPPAPERLVCHAFADPAWLLSGGWGAAEGVGSALTAEAAVDLAPFWKTAGLTSFDKNAQEARLGGDPATPRSRPASSSSRPLSGPSPASVPVRASSHVSRAPSHVTRQPEGAVPN